MTDLSAPEQAENVHGHPEAVRVPTALGLHPRASRPQGHHGTAPTHGAVSLRAR